MKGLDLKRMLETEDQKHKAAARKKVVGLERSSRKLDGFVNSNFTPEIKIRFFDSL